MKKKLLTFITLHLLAHSGAVASMPSSFCLNLMSGVIDSETARPLPTSIGMKVIGRHITPEGVFFVAEVHAHSSADYRNHLGYSPELIQLYPDFFKAIGIAITGDVNHQFRLQYPGDVKTLNHFLDALAGKPQEVGLRYWESAAQNEIPTVTLAKAFISSKTPLVPYTTQGRLHFHDFFAHWAHLILPPKVFSVQRGVLEFWLKVLEDPKLSQNSTLNKVASNAIHGYIKWMDSRTADKIPDLIGALASDIHAYGQLWGRPVTFQDLIDGKVRNAPLFIEKLRAEVQDMLLSEVDLNSLRVKGSSAREVGRSLIRAAKSQNILDKDELEQLKKLLKEASSEVLGSSDIEKLHEDILIKLGAIHI